MPSTRTANQNLCRRLAVACLVLASIVAIPFSQAGEPARSERLTSSFAEEAELSELKAQLYRLLPDERITVHQAGGNLLLGGTVASAERKKAALAVAGAFMAGRSGQLVDLVQIGGARQVMLEVQVAEVSRTLVKRLGVKFNAAETSGGWTIGAVQGDAIFPDPTDTREALEQRLPIFSSGTPIGPRLKEFLPEDLREDGSLFARYLSGGSLFNLVLEAARDERLARVLAEPTLTTVTGQEAAFLSGGEFPLPVSQDDGRTTIEYKEFGIALRFLPQVLEDSTISLRLNISVSELDSQQQLGVAVREQSGVYVAPSLRKRSASSTVELKPGETIGIAGLIDETLREKADKFPGLGDIPLLGMLFSSQEFIKGETELVIFVTPHFARARRQERPRLPTDSFVEPDSIDFYLFGRLEGNSRTSTSLGERGVTGPFGHQL